MDVLVANAYSKAVQRAALDEFLLDKPNVDYFPSYEFVTLSNPGVAWSRHDYRHVSPDVVDRIMANVLGNYVTSADARPAAPKSAADLLSSLRMMIKLEEHQAVADLISEHRAVADSSTDILLMEATALRQLNRPAESWDALHKAVILTPNRPLPLERLIMMCRPLARLEAAATHLAAHAERFPDREEFRTKMDWVQP
jgi:hypothetical protein